MTDDAPSAADAALESRLAAVERALTDGETDIDGLPDAAALAVRVDELETTVERLDDRVVELEAATHALRGYVGGVRAVNESVEQRADAALAAVESLETALRDGPDPALTAVGTNAETPIAAADAAASDGGGRGKDETEPADSAGADETPQGLSLAARLRDVS